MAAGDSRSRMGAEGIAGVDLRPPSWEQDMNVASLFWHSLALPYAVYHFRFDPTGRYLRSLWKIQKNID